MLLKLFHFHYVQAFCQSRLCKADHAYLTYLMLQRQLSHLNGRKVKSYVPIADQCAPWKISSGVEKLVLQALQL
jgi:hypothetical protein